ncbi:hypothetical protein BBJ28_00004388 [Nothophytophthora sp. Chile5]|nr:hypothetical protein BBJ28_00004388 [Nothophytophthora sp. Chile5]
MASKATAAARQTLAGSGTAASLALEAFRGSMERSRVMELASEGSQTLSHSSVSRQLSRGASLGRTINLTAALNAKVAAASSRSSITAAELPPLGPSAARLASQGARVQSSDPTAPMINDLMQRVINASPGCYTDDDGSNDVLERYNFFVHGKRFLFAPCSLGLFDEANTLRQHVIWLVTSHFFDRVVLALIATNSVLLAIVDVRHVDSQGEPANAGSLRNTVADYADSIFTVLFSIEFSLKIVAMGLFGDRGAYLMDPWNWIDFAVVVVGLLAALPNVPNVGAFRAFRVLRPLRFFNAVPGIKKLVTALLKSIPELLTVVAFLSFLFFLYGVIGVQLWSGGMHSRCRLAPYPLALDADLQLEDLPAYQQQVLQTPELFRCLGDGAGATALETENDTWSHDSSPWRTPRSCFWPVADEDSGARLCSLDGTSDEICPVGQTCGSDFDRHGNFRFTHSDEQLRARLQLGATYDTNLDFGLLGFDHIGQAAMVLFICMPREGWTDVMYMLEDAGFGVAAPPLYLVSFVLVSSYFMLNLALAVIWENFSDASLVEAEERKIRREIAASAPPPSLAKASQTSTSALRQVVGRVVGHWVFSSLVTSLILLNTVLLSLDQYPVDEQLAATVDVLNFVLTLAFLLEAALKIVGLGWRHWAEDRYNIFDAVVVALGIVEAVVSPPQFLSGAAYHVKSQSFSGLRSLRIFRLFKLARYIRSWTSLHKLLGLIASAVSEIGNFSVLLFLFMYVYALLGMQMFGNRFRFDAAGFPLSSAAASTDGDVQVPRANFDSMLWSGVTVFQILTGENWNNVLFDGWRATGIGGVVYFVSLVVFGNFILLNLFLAILLSHFEDTDNASQDANGLEEREALRNKSRVMPKPSLALSPGDNAHSSTRRRKSIAPPGVSGSSKHSQQLGFSAKDRQDSQERGSGDSQVSMARVPTRSTSVSYPNHRLSHQDASSLPAERFTQKRSPVGHALFVLGPRNPLRRFAWDVVTHPRFDSAVLGLVVASTVCVALDNPLSDPEGTFVRVVGYVDSILAAIFVLEVALKVVAQGFCMHPQAYLRNGWNVMDFVITAVAMPGLQFISSSGSGDSQGLKLVSGLRTFRALRPLRMIHRNPGLKLVVSSLVAAIPQMLNVGMVCLLLLLIFSIIAVNNLKGRFFACTGSAFDALSSAQQDLITTPRLWANLSSSEQQWFNTSMAALYVNASVSALNDNVLDLPGVDGITSRMVCGYLNASWERTIPQSFDNVLLALLTFFEISTTEGWVTLMLAGVDATDVDMQPIANHGEGWTLFFIAFISLGSFFLIQLFIGVVIENFNRMKETLDGTRLLSSSQREWLLISEVVLNLHPMRKRRTPRNQLRRFCFRVAQSPSLEMVTMGAIMLNTFMMGLTYFGEEDLYARIIESANVFFTLLFALEAVIKVVGLGRYYWKESWNIFDFVVVLGSCFGMIYTWAGGEAVGSSAAMIRSVRVLRLIKLIQTAPSLRQLVNTLAITLPSLVNIGGFLLLVFFIYAAVGVQLFAKVKLDGLVTSHANFQGISVAMVTLMRCATGERWNDLMHQLAVTDDCVNDPSYDPTMCGFADFDGCTPLDGCGTSVAFLYFCSFTMLITYVLLNIFIAVILEGFANEKDRANGVLLPQHVRISAKSRLVPLSWHMLPNLIQQLDEPLGYGKHNETSVKEITTFIEFLDIAIYNGNRVLFSDVARKLGKFVLDVVLTDWMAWMRIQVNEAPVVDLPSTIEVSQKWRALLKGGKLRKLERYRLNHIHASVLLHDAVRSLIFRDELRARVHKFTELTSHLLQPGQPRQQQASGGRSSRISGLVHRERGESGASDDDKDDGGDGVPLLSSDGTGSEPGSHI